jgi:putative SOS response-associated peptidase YedK
MALAGLWEEWVDRESGEIIHSTTIVTTHGNALMQKIHNNPKADGPRMPVILPRENKTTGWLPAKPKTIKKP